MWLWITAALILSYLPLINKKIDISNYIWILIPIDAYGISVAGATLKPYMIFALVLPVLFYCKNKNKGIELIATKDQLILGIISVLIIAVNLINCDNFSSVKAAFMTLVVYICALFYTSCFCTDDREQLSDVFIASAFGCGIVYIIGYILLQIGADIEGIVAIKRENDGMFLRLTNMVSGDFVAMYRLRGFAYDPNSMSMQFIFGISAAISKLSKKFSLYHILTVLISVVCILLSSSRMGLLCCGLAILVTLIINLSQIENSKKKAVGIIASLLCCCAPVFFLISRFGQEKLSGLLSTYTNRSSLTDEYGRFSIWKDCLKIYWEKSPFLGVGYNNMSLYTATERMTHNTWLQFICEFGILVGSLAVMYFLGTMIIGWAKINKHKGSSAYIALLIGYTVTIVSITSVDNVTCSYLWFGALLLLQLANQKPTQRISE